MTETTRAKRMPSRRNGARAPQQGIGRGTAPHSRRSVTQSVAAAENVRG